MCVTGCGLFSGDPCDPCFVCYSLSLMKWNAVLLDFWEKNNNIAILENILRKGTERENLKVDEDMPNWNY